MFSKDDLIFSYTRKQAIEDGTLVSVDKLARQAGFTVPVVLTAAAWSDCVEWSDDDTKRTRTSQDETGRLWDVLWMAKSAARRSNGNPVVQFVVFRVKRTSKNGKPQAANLVCHIGPGDEAEPVITIGFSDDF